MILNVTDQLRRDEGVRNFPYTDTVGKVTIGVGRNLTNVGLSDSEVNDLLANDINRVTGLLHQGLPWFPTLDIVRQGVLINMGFNLGVHGLLGFHDTLSFMSKSDWIGAATAMLDSTWARQVGARSQRLADQLKTGEWQ